MTGNEFLQQLAQHLQCLPDEERANAMAYYHEYLEEAGEENEEDAVDHLGSPQSVAERIIKEVGVNSVSQTEKKVTPAQYTASPMEQKPSDSSADAGRIILAIVILLLTSPFWIAVPIVWFSIVFTLPIIPISFFIAGIAALFQGIFDIVSGMLSVGLFDLGGALVILGLFMFLWYPCFKGAWALTKLFGKLCSSVFNFLIGKEKRK